MSYLLVVESSITGPDSVSRPLVAEFARAWAAAGTDRRVVTRDLATDPVPHLATAGLHYPEAMRRPHETVDPAAQRLQDELIDEAAGAAAIVIGAPMYNYSVPSTLRAWLDHLHVLGVTTSDADSTGRLHGKPTVVVSPRGLAYDNTSTDAAGDYVIPALERLLAGSMGMEVTSIPVEYTLADRMPPLAEFSAASAASLAAARERLSSLAASL